MRRRDRINIVEYLYHMEARLEDAVRDCSYRYIRRDLDSVELLEEIIANENLKLFKGIRDDFCRILQLSEEEDT